MTLYTVSRACSQYADGDKTDEMVSMAFIIYDDAPHDADVFFNVNDVFTDGGG